MNLLVELRLALRRLIKLPGFTVTTIVTLALAIGANTAIFSVVYAVLMHPSGIDAPDRLAVMRTRYTNLSLDFPYVSVPDYQMLPLCMTRSRVLHWKIRSRITSSVMAL